MNVTANLATFSSHKLTREMTSVTPCTGDGEDEIQPPMSSESEAPAVLQPTTPSMPIQLQSKSLSKWISSSLINVRSFKTFMTPGGGCVSAVVPTSAGTVLVDSFISLSACIHWLKWFVTSYKLTPKHTGGPNPRRGT
jgi:hypothetical protein